MATKEELMKRAQELDVPGRSNMDKEELERAVADAEGSSDERLVSEAEEEAAAQEKLDTVEEEAGEAHAELVAKPLDSPGPLNIQSPHERIMTGAQSDEQAKEQERLMADRPDGFVGDVSEAGAVRHSSENKVGSRKENLGEGDDRDIWEVNQEDVIDFPPPLGAGQDVDASEIKRQAPVAGAPFATSPVAGASDRVYAQKGVFYTDGLSGGADHNLERAYELPEVLQSNNPVIRASGDESLSEAAADDKSEEDLNRAEAVKHRDDE